VLVLAGKGSWWVPAWLDRMLPHMDVEGSGAQDDEPREGLPSGAPTP
jgi:RND superfamily putative drug exporter